MGHFMLLQPHRPFIKKYCLTVVRKPQGESQKFVFINPDPENMLLSHLK